MKTSVETFEGLKAHVKSFLVNYILDGQDCKDLLTDLESIPELEQQIEENIRTIEDDRAIASEENHRLRALVREACEAGKVGDFGIPEYSAKGHNAALDAILGRMDRDE